MENEPVPLVFGTDGWRDVIADRFTFENVRRAARAYGSHLQARSTSAATVLVGYDTRFMGSLFALEVAGVLKDMGIEALVSSDFLPTPALSFAVKRYSAAGGVMLTASHNPPEYGGFKLKGSYGGTATDEIYQDVAGRLEAKPVLPPGARTRSAVDRFDIRDDYFGALSALVDLAALRDADLTLVHDPMGGAASGWLRAFAMATKALRVEETRGRPDPLFHGVNPEPIAANLLATSELMQAASGRPVDGPAFAVATDGDGDRLGVVLPGGAYFNSHQIFAVLLDHLARKRQGGSATVVKTFTVSRIIELMARTRGLDVLETRVGFKYVVNAMLAGDVVVGGEESGGIGVGTHIPERDGIANALLLLEAVVGTGEPLAETFDRLERETGWHHAYDRLDLRLLDDGTKERVLDHLSDPPKQFGAWHVTSVEDLDGTKLNLAAEVGLEPTAWVLFRASGTEPVLRLYCEAPDSAEVVRLLEVAESLVRTV